MEKVAVVKIGGNVIDDPEALKSFLADFSAIKGKKILIHGGGKLATRLAEQLGITQEMNAGRRITDEETLKIVTMVYAGYINKNIVAQLYALSCKAIGICGADGNVIKAHKRENAPVDYGFVGDIDKVKTKELTKLLEEHDAVVIAPITHDGKGQLLNTNADTIAQEIAQALSKSCKVQLIYCFEKAGVLLNIADEKTCIPKISPKSFKQLVQEGSIYDGMLPKLQNAFIALDKGVNKVRIGKSTSLKSLLKGRSGTTIGL
ncbi:acetylglutamate kinase [Chitinophagaceae bacterium MMS25-I14]